jgi:hypothetical protein
VCHLLDIIILCPIIYLDHFWCIKYQYIYIYIYINRKRKRKKGKEKGFPQLIGSGGIRPSQARTRGRAGRRPTWPASGGTARGRRRGRGPMCQREGEADGARRGVTGGRTGRSPTTGEVRGGSPPGSRFYDDGVVARHGRG